MESHAEREGTSEGGMEEEHRAWGRNTWIARLAKRRQHKRRGEREGWIGSGAGVGD